MSRGSIIDMAIGIILGASFTKIVDALVNHVLMPPLSLLVGGVDFSYLKLTLRGGTPEVAINLGVLVNSLFNFFVVGLSVFLILKLLNRFHMKAAIFTKKSCTECKMEVPIEATRCAYCTTLLGPQSDRI